MVKSKVKKVVWVGRATVFMVGLTLILALVLGVATTALGATGGNFILGKANNTSSMLTGLVSTLADAAKSALTVENKSGGPAQYIVSVLSIGTWKGGGLFDSQVRFCSSYRPDWSSGNGNCEGATGFANVANQLTLEPGKFASGTAEREVTLTAGTYIFYTRIENAAPTQDDIHANVITKVLVRDASPSAAHRGFTTLGLQTQRSVRTHSLGRGHSTQPRPFPHPQRPREPGGWQNRKHLCPGGDNCRVVRRLPQRLAARYGPLRGGAEPALFPLALGAILVRQRRSTGQGAYRSR
jgi:hypothetical protein